MNDELSRIIRERVGPYELAARMIDFALNEEYPPEIRLNACGMILDRCWGLPVLHVVRDDDSGLERDFFNLAKGDY
jgi:hypothetical protein